MRKYKIIEGFLGLCCIWGLLENICPFKCAFKKLVKAHETDYIMTMASYFSNGLMKKFVMIKWKHNDET